MPDDGGLVYLSWEKDPLGYEVQWYKDLDKVWELTGVISTLNDDHGEYIVPRGGFRGKRERYEVRLAGPESRSTSFADLANSEGREGALQFVRKWGLLTNDLAMPLGTFLKQRDLVTRAARALKSDDAISDLLTEVLRSGRWRPSPHRREDSTFLNQARPNLLGVGLLHARYDRGKRGLYFQVDTLLQFCAFELLDARVGGKKLIRCDECKQLLHLHNKGRPHRYCSPVCKMRAWRAVHGDRLNEDRRLKRQRRRPAP